MCSWTDKQDGSGFLKMITIESLSAGPSASEIPPGRELWLDHDLDVTNLAVDDAIALQHRIPIVDQRYQEVDRVGIVSQSHVSLRRIGLSEDVRVEDPE